LIKTVVINILANENNINFFQFYKILLDFSNYLSLNFSSLYLALTRFYIKKTILNFFRYFINYPGFHCLDIINRCRCENVNISSSNTIRTGKLGYTTGCRDEARPRFRLLSKTNMALNIFLILQANVD
jgi:hypothetical protein